MSGDPHEASAGGAPPARRLLVWDAPNLDFILGNLLGRRTPRPEERPRFDTLARWLVDRTAPGEVPEATVFINLPPDRVEQVRGFIDFLRSTGFGVFAKPKVRDEDDIDAELLAHITARAADGPVSEVLLASCDQYRDRPGQTLADLAQRVPLTVLGFREVCTAAITMDGVGFIDLEDIPGLFEVALTREVPLESLPLEGAWLPPRQTLTDLFG